MRVVWRRVVLAIGLGSIGWVATAQQTAEKRPPRPVTANFTGAVASLDASDVSAVRFQYAAGARSYWHTHGGNQILVLEQGRGRMQIRGQAMRELLPGQPVLLPGGVPHWHGAAPDQGLVQIAVNVGGATFTGPVSDEEYRGGK
ncbi:MAG: cupin domain-containing protein [Acidimicrobiia bacterium]|nr:cupin domain-containing protein [Acidimicrobiia bacterium]